ncbi:hypothetical protein AYO21_01777 [Fonsecaea monophora]|uniref:Uncharacterized protein n=1 Tax=Fonsecaea monophora TaxID=254056 RepID=A0A177FI22_9EURO|nr:hypothetical protein AYO21_01777 [Fonsecaea monophora]KAH0831573.1 hypothetical protein FOPE_02879 [Fonsecaea pedrosoi]OAG43925.1 hypothetical protein AYO21_01777 [Fonsecaea monophora]
MRTTALFAGLLPQLQARDTYDDGAYTEVVQATSWSSSASYYTTYGSTAIVTVTTYIPCPVIISYTTVRYCSSCSTCDGGCGSPTSVLQTTVCVPKLCSTAVNDVGQATTTPFVAGEYAVAYVTSNGGGGQPAVTTSIPASSCTTYEQIALTGIDCQTLPACGGGGGRSSGLTCEAKPCTTYIDADGDGNYDPDETLTEGTQYFFTEFARLTVNGQVTSTPASLCEALTVPTPWAADVQATVACGSDNDNNNDANGDGVQVITYTYTTNGATIVVATTLPSHGGPFHLTAAGDGSSSSGCGPRAGGDLGRTTLFWTCVGTAVVAGVGVGMIVL